MDLYLSGKPTSELQTNHILTTISNLYRLRIISDESKVWSEVGDFTPRVWALTNKSTCIHYLLTNVPGCVRITGDRVRWAPTQDGSQSNPHVDIDLTEIFKDSDESYFTLVIEHCNPSQGVSIIESTSKQNYEDGVYTSSNSRVKVIDANSYKGTELMWKHPDGSQNMMYSAEAHSFFPNITELVEGSAITRGFAFMTKNMTKAERSYLEDNFDDFKFSFDQNEMKEIVKYATFAVSRISSQISAELNRRIPN